MNCLDEAESSEKRRRQPGYFFRFLPTRNSRGGGYEQSTTYVSVDRDGGNEALKDGIELLFGSTVSPCHGIPNSENASFGNSS